MNTEQKLESLLKSPIYQAAIREADNQRVADHAAAVDVLLAHEADTAGIEQSKDATEKARLELEPLEIKLLAARQKYHAAAAEQQRLAWLHERKADRLRAEINKNLPPIIASTEIGLRCAEGDIRAKFQDRVREPAPGSLQKPAEYSSNISHVDRALAQANKVRDILGQLAFEAMAGDAITSKLSKDVLLLIDLAKIAGAMVAHRFPEEIRKGLSVELPDREKGRIAVFR